LKLIDNKTAMFDGKILWINHISLYFSYLYHLMSTL
jgi:hypothetical protein